MRTKLKSGRDIPSAMKIGRRGVCTQDEIFNELARLNWEKAKLNKEKLNCQERIEQISLRFGQIDERLRQIKEIEKSLQQRLDQMMAKATEKKIKENSGIEAESDIENANQAYSKGKDSSSSKEKEKYNELVIKY